MARPVHQYDIPASLLKAQPGLPKNVGIRQLTADEELQASKVGKFDLTKTRYDAVKRAICELDGKPASYADGQVDEYWEKCGPKVRALLIQAFDKLAQTSDEEDEEFFKSEQVKVA